MKKITLILLLSFPFVAFGQCVDGDCENGVGTYLWEDGTVNNGSWKNGELNGVVQDIHYDEEGRLLRVFDGVMIMGVENGYGVETLYSDDGYVLGTYIGNWEDGNWNGWGLWIEPEGYIEKGIFKDGELVD